MCCKSASELLEKSKVRKLTFKEVVSLKKHLLMCKPCRKYGKLSEQLDSFIAKSASNEDSKLELALDSSQKQKLIEALKAKTQE